MIKESKIRGSKPRVNLTNLLYMLSSEFSPTEIEGLKCRWRSIQARSDLSGKLLIDLHITYFIQNIFHPVFVSKNHVNDPNVGKYRILIQIVLRLRLLFHLFKYTQFEIKS